MNNIHKTAIIGPDVKLGENNTIGANVVIDGKITIGNHNIIGLNSMIVNNVSIGNHNRIVGAASIGSLGEMGTQGDIFLEEFITVNSPVRKTHTKIGNNCYLMARTHVPHDAELKNNVVMATNSLVGGGSVVHDYAYVGLASITHQWVDIGESAMIGLQAAVTKFVPPFCTVTGIPAKILKFNRTGAERRGFNTEHLDEVENHFREIIQGEYSSENPIVKTIESFINQNKDSLRTFLK
jgi:UDP-N-acetylglucosamine acyltransferase